MWWHWIRRQARKHMKPVDQRTAEKWNNRLTFAYFGIAWTIFGYAVITFANQNPSSAAQERSGVYYAKLLGTENATIVRVNKLTVQDTFEYNAKEAVEKENMEKDAEFYGKKDDEELLE